MISAWATKFAIATALETLIPEDVDIAQVGLYVGAVPVNDWRRIYVLAVPPYQSRPVFQSGSQVRESDYVVPVLVEVEIQTGADVQGQAETELACATLVNQIEALCLADPSWGGVCFSSGVALAQEFAGPIADQSGGFLAHALLEIHVRTQGD